MNVFENVAPAPGLPAFDALADQLVAAARQLEEDAIADFFGSTERAEKMVRLFPGRYDIELQRRAYTSFNDTPESRLVIRDLWTKRTGRYLLRLNLTIA